MKLFNVLVSAESPLHITNMVSRNNYFSASFIPGPTLRGAFLTELMRKDKEAFDMALKNMFFSPAYPVCRNGHSPKQSLPTHFAMLRCKVCSRLERIKEAYQVNVLEKLVNGNETPYVSCPDKLEHGVSNMEKAPDLYCPICRRPISISGHIERTASTAIDRETRTSSPTGMLFFYEYIAPRAELMTQILVTADEVTKYVPSEMDIKVGRGASRGFGRVKLRFSDATSQMKDSLGTIRDSLQRSFLVMAAKSPCFHVEIEDGRGLVSNATLSVEEFKMSLERAAKIVMKDIDSEAVGKAISEVIFRGGTCWMRGWSLKGDIAKPSLLAATPGSLFIMKFRQPLQGHEDVIALLEFTGIGLHSSIGVNNVYFPELR